MGVVVFTKVRGLAKSGNENSWMVMSTTPQIFLDGNEHYHPRIFTTLQNHNKSVKQYVLLPSFFISTILYF